MTAVPPNGGSGGRSGGPVTLVKHAVADGAATVAAVACVTGLPTSLVEAVTAELARRGELRRESVGFGCPDGACGSCSSSSGCPAPDPSVAVGVEISR